MAGLINVDIGSIIGQAGTAIKDIANAIRGTNPELAAKLIEVQDKMDTAQSSINQAEASNTNMLVAGWRPFVGWVCGASFALNAFVFPLINYVLSFWNITLTLPALHQQVLDNMLYGMLGIGGLRTFEKYKGVA